MTDAACFTLRFRAEKGWRVVIARASVDGKRMIDGALEPRLRIDCRIESIIGWKGHDRTDIDGDELVPIFMVDPAANRNGNRAMR